MRNQSPFTDKFSQYLSRKLGPQRAEDIVFGNHITSKHHMMSPEIPPMRYSQRTPTQLSINSSNFLSPNSVQRSHVSSRSLCKTSTNRKLKKMRDIEQNVCSICLDAIRNQAQMSCGHRYCHECLQKWLETSSKCPYCRSECRYYVRDGMREEIEQRLFEHVEMEVDEGLDYECYMCEVTNEGDEVVICDRCEVYACHLRCDPRLRGVVLGEDEEWFCHFCS